MARKVKIAVSLSPEVLELLDRYADGRSRSRSIEEELLRSLRAREWERLAAATGVDEAAEQLEWASMAFHAVDRQLAADEGSGPARKRRKRS